MNTYQRSNLEYQRRIDKALEFVRANLDKSIVLKDVARAACFSPYHFHRIFRGLMGKTLGEYITRKRLERAAIKLAYSSETTVTTVLRPATDGDGLWESINAIVQLPFATGARATQHKSCRYEPV